MSYRQPPKAGSAIPLRIPGYRVNGSSTVGGVA